MSLCQCICVNWQQITTDISVLQIYQSSLFSTYHYIYKVRSTSHVNQRCLEKRQSRALIHLKIALMFQRVPEIYRVWLNEMLTCGRHNSCRFSHTYFFKVCTIFPTSSDTVVDGTFIFTMMYQNMKFHLRNASIAFWNILKCWSFKFAKPLDEYGKSQNPRTIIVGPLDHMHNFSLM